MARQRHLARAPIVEAIFDIRASLNPTFDAASLLQLAQQERERYPSVEERRAFRAFMQIESGGSPKSGTEDLGVDGVVLKAQDGLTLAQFRRDGFTLNRLHPYTSWEHLLPEVERLWQVYAAIAHPEIVSRIAVRFINRLNLPLPIDDFRHYLIAPPAVPDSVPQAVSAFLTRVTVVDPDGDLQAHIVQALEPGLSTASADILLDIDAFAQRERGVGSEEIATIFGGLRRLKNNIFFGSITEATAEMYE